MESRDAETSKNTKFLSTYRGFDINHASFDELSLNHDIRKSNIEEDKFLISEDIAFQNDWTVNSKILISNPTCNWPKEKRSYLLSLYYEDSLTEKNVIYKATFSTDKTVTLYPLQVGRSNADSTGMLASFPASENTYDIALSCKLGKWTFQSSSDSEYIEFFYNSSVIALVKHNSSPLDFSLSTSLYNYESFWGVNFENNFTEGPIDNISGEGQIKTFNYNLKLDFTIGLDNTEKLQGTFVDAFGDSGLNRFMYANRNTDQDIPSFYLVDAGDSGFQGNFYIYLFFQGQLSDGKTITHLSAGYTLNDGGSASYDLKHYYTVLESYGLILLSID